MDSAWIALLPPAAALLWFSQRYAWWRPAVPWERPRILMYHLVTPHPPGCRTRGMRVRPEDFERQLRWLRENHFHFATLSELSGENPPPPRTVAITFDDGYEDNFTTALPLLRRYGARATLYLVADREEGSDWSAKKKAHHNSGELTREPKLSDEQVREMIDSGLIELAAHTLTHANLARVGPEEREREIGGSREWLERRFGRAVTSFAYPFGIWGPEDRQAVERAGFRSAVTTEPGIDPWPFPDPLAIRRVKVSGKENLLAFRMRMRGGRRGLWK
jgi:peptidoglycan/xylan/chitin deacetylase (PgdA/CDA1 family)